jgi:hypothetical protein
LKERVRAAILAGYDPVFQGAQPGHAHSAHAPERASA